MSKRDALIVIFTLLLLVSGYLLYQETFAKYKKKVIQEVDISLASWDIKLNNESIAGKNTISGNITPIFESNEYVAENVIAPGINGYFDIDIDATSVDVSFSYLLKIEQNDEYPDIVAYGYALDLDNPTPLDIPEDGINGEIVHNTESTKIRVFVRWDDSNENVMDNAADTAVAINNSEIRINANFNFTQINK